MSNTFKYSSGIQTLRMIHVWPGQTLQFWLCVANHNSAESLLKERHIVACIPAH